MTPHFLTMDAAISVSLYDSPFGIQIPFWRWVTEITVLEILKRCVIVLDNFFLKNIWQQLYSEIVKSSSSEDESAEHFPLDLLKAGLVKWLAKYQIEDEHDALQKALKLSKVRFL